jgi:hypothetical protein
MQYLYYIDLYGGEKHFLNAAAANFNTDKRAVNRIVASLAARGLVVKDGDAYALSETGRVALSPQAEQSDIVCLWLRRSGLDERIVRREAFNIVCDLMPEMAEWITAEGLFLFAISQKSAVSRREIASLSGTKWYTSVSFLKPKTGDKSMGQRGIKNAFVVLRSGRLYLEFSSRIFSYMPEAGGEPARGKLSRFWYMQNGAEDWREVFPKRNLWRVPMDVMKVSFGDGMLQARLRIKALAEADCGMPESEADLFCVVEFREKIFRDG